MHFIDIKITLIILKHTLGDKGKSVMISILYFLMIRNSPQNLTSRGKKVRRRSEKG